MPLLLAVTAVVVRCSPAANAWLRIEVNMLPSHKLNRAAALALAWLSPSTAPAQDLPPPRPMTIGMNAGPIRWYETTLPFANLVMGSEWVDARWGHLAAQYQDRDGAILSLPAGEGVHRFVAVPQTGPEGIDVRCTWKGSGTIAVQQTNNTLVSSSGSIRFHVASHHVDPKGPWLNLNDVDPRRPFRDLDCRDVRLAPAVRFRPEALEMLRGYGVIRFMDWQNANANEAVTWATRHGPSGNLILDGDGVSIEDMMAVTRELGADPWFVMPWNADDDYIAHFAKLVASTLPPNRHVYVETGNEVWNSRFPVARQAIKEGRARNLSADDFEAGMRRYAQRTVEVMRIWETAFAGRTGLVRVLATQHVRPESARTALSFADTARHVDAVATAPYFGEVFGGADNGRDKILERLSIDMTAALKDAAANRRVAAEFGKRYLAYEGGESLETIGQAALIEQLRHDPAQFALYQRYLAEWRKDIGDVLCLFTSGSRTSFGLSEWEDETPAEAPKLRAVRDVAPAR